MPMSERSRRDIVTLVAGAVWLVCAAGPARALDGPETQAEAKAPLALFANPQAALRKGIDVYRSGDVKSSVEAFKYAAANGNPLAQWKLGKMYADGDGVPHDDVKAFDYFAQIVANYDEDSDDPRDLSVVSNAFVAVGVYSLNGIPNSKVRPDPDRALDMFQFAATNFRDPNAQYNLARMYLDGSGVTKDTRQAVRWLALAADKNHYQAEALLGHILYNGFDGVSRQRARGLMWLMCANDAASGSKDAWITDLRDKALTTASDADRQAATVYYQNHLRKRD